MEFHIVRSRPIDNVVKIFLEKGNIIQTVNLLRDTGVISKKANIRMFDAALKIVDEQNEKDGPQNSSLRDPTDDTSKD